MFRRTQQKIAVLCRQLNGTAANVESLPNRAKVLTLNTMNPNVKLMEYAMRGPIVTRAAEIEKELQNGFKKPFSEIIWCNIGDCHAMGQEPLTFLRQVLAIASHPNQLMSHPSMPEDAKQRAQGVLQDCGGNNLGAYSNSAGVEIIRKDIASYIQKRDGGVPCDYNNIFLCSGATQGIQYVLQMLMTIKSGKDRAGVMIAIPQFPLYSATLVEYNACQIGYFLDESRNWAIDIDELERALVEAAPNCKPRAIVVINPGNPTGQILTKENVKEIIQFAKRNNLFILADEVYQSNIYAPDCEFHSFKKVLSELGPDYAGQELASFMSTSKGYMGECGARGGYCEVINLTPDVMAMLLKLLATNTCSSVWGQTTMDVVVNPPQPGEPSFEHFVKEKNLVLGELKKKAKLVTDTFNSIEGVQCNEVQGAMYAFPRIEIPERACKHAESKGQAPDSFYCFEFLEQTGVCVIPGSGFGQVPGTHHFRMTVLPPTEKIKLVMEKFKRFHADFVKKWS